MIALILSLVPNARGFDIDSLVRIISLCQSAAPIITMRLFSTCLLSSLATAQMIGRYSNNDTKSSSTFTTINGRIFTPGLIIIDSPQPNTPMGGNFLHVALDISGDGALPFPPETNPNAAARFHNITLFLTSTILGRNFTISNGTNNMAPLTPILTQEPGSTVKHVNFEWPSCLAGDGKDAKGTLRGAYNISIHESYRLNGSDFYTIFNLPISVTNKIEQFPGAQQFLTDPRPGPLSVNGSRMECAMLENRLLGQEELVGSVRNPASQPYGTAGKLQVVKPDTGGGSIGSSGNQNGGNQNGGNQSPALSVGSTLSLGLSWILMPTSVLILMLL